MNRNPQIGYRITNIGIRKQLLKNMEDRKIKSFEDLETWKFCRELRKELTLLAKRLSAEEKFRLTDQIIRAARSITDNLAEGYGRFHYQENIQFCRQSRGSLFESRLSNYLFRRRLYI